MKNSIDIVYERFPVQKERKIHRSNGRYCRRCGSGRSVGID